VFALLSLGFTLSLDNFRVSIALGGLKPTVARSVKTSLIFGLWDGVTPAIGIIVGHYLSQKIDSTATTVAAIGLAAYGLFVVVRALVSPEPADPDLRMATRGLPIPLSVDNVDGVLEARGSRVGRQDARWPGAHRRLRRSWALTCHVLLCCRRWGGTGHER